MLKWALHVTVAAIVKNSDKYLMVKEKPEDRIVYNQPAGHLEDNESLLDAVKREVFEETGVNFNPTELIGIYRLRQQVRHRTYLRFAFTGEVSSTKLMPNDKDIIDAVWLSLPEIEQLVDQLRGPQVMAGISDYEKGIRYNLEILRDIF